jgi:sulfonate transport system permease protein
MSTTNPGSSAIGAVPVGASRALERDAAGRARRRFALGGWQRLVSPLVVLIIWQLVNVAHLVSASKLPPPTRVISTAATLITTNSAAYGTLQGALLTSLERMIVGFAFGAVVALGLALIAGLSRAGENAVDPLMQAIRTLPLFGLIPVFIIWFGIGDLPKELLVAIGAAIPLYLNTFAGIRGVDGKLAELGHVLGLSRSELIRHVILPGALPSILVGLRQSLGVAWLSLVVAEQLNTHAGLGFMINQGTQFLQNDVIFVALLCYTILGLLTDWFVRRIERRALAWRGGLLAA